MTGASNSPFGLRKVVLAAGGTGGHLFPAEALAAELLSRGLEVMLLTDHRGGGFGARLPAVTTRQISAGGIAGIRIMGRLRNIFSLARGYFQARRHLKDFGADAVVGFGGYPSVPPVLAAAHLGLRVLLHEQNAVLGRANRFLVRRAAVLCTAHPEVLAIPKTLKAEIRRTGNPVRPAVAAVGRRPYPLPQDQGPLQLLVMGGSQGARAFNDLVPAAIARLPEDLRARLKIYQQVPGDAGTTVASSYDACGIAAEVAAFFDNVPELLATSHLVLCRAGASTIAELATAGRPAILVPLPGAIDNHQVMNAKTLDRIGGGWLMPQSSLTVESLAEQLRSLLSAPVLLAEAAHISLKAAERNAAERLADALCGISNGGPQENGKDPENDQGDAAAAREAAA